MKKPERCHSSHISYDFWTNLEHFSSGYIAYSKQTFSNKKKKRGRFKLTPVHLFGILFARDWEWSGNGGHWIFFLTKSQKSEKRVHSGIMKTFLKNWVWRLVWQRNYQLFPVNIETQLNKLKVVSNKSTGNKLDSNLICRKTYPWVLMQCSCYVNLAIIVHLLDVRL